MFNDTRVIHARIYFKMPTDTQIIPNSMPNNPDLISLNCLLEKSLHSKFYFYWNTLPNKIIYERLTYLENLSKTRANFAHFFFGKIQKDPTYLEISFLQKKEHILNTYFFLQENQLNIIWYNFKGFKPLIDFTNSLYTF